MKGSLDTDMKRLVLGQIGKPHGVKGWLRLKSFTSPPENILEYPQIGAEIGQRWQGLEIDQFRQQPNGLVVHFKGFDDPDTAGQLTGIEVSVVSNELPALKTGDYYWHQLEGLKVINQQSQLFGQVEKLLETGANDVLVVVPTEDSIDNRQRLIPYLAGSVIEQVDLESKIVRVNWEADYLD